MLYTVYLHRQGGKPFTDLIAQGKHGILFILSVSLTIAIDSNRFAILNHQGTVEFPVMIVIDSYRHNLQSHLEVVPGLCVQGNAWDGLPVNQHLAFT